MRVRSGPFLLTLLLTIVLAATILLTREPTPIATASVPDPPSETVAAPPRTQTPTNPLCENGTAVSNPADKPGLVADCSALLAAKDTLRGTATLNWSADRAITAWTGVTVESLPSGAPRRVTKLVLQSASLDGSIPAALGDLSALRELRLQWNQLSGGIPAALGNLGQLTYLGLGGNQLTGAIPPELGAIGSTLTTLHLTGPNPLPSGIGLTGAIPPALGDLTGLQYLYLDGNRLTGPIPTRLRWLTDLRGLFLNKNQLTGAIPTQLGTLTELRELRLESNQLTGAVPTQLEGLRDLRKLYIKNNSGLTGCVPSDLSDVRYNDVDRLYLLTCASDAPATPMTPLPTYTVTVTATGGGGVEPGGATTHDEDSEVTLTASWNDATHTFSGWGGDCADGGTALTCVLTILGDKSVTATFQALPTDRCATTTAADCIRAVYKGAPDDYAQVQEIPADRLLTPGSDGRYQVERGWQITVVTAAPLPTDYTRFYLQQSPLGPPGTPDAVSFSQLIKPVGTTYTFTVTTDERGASLVTFDLTAARPRPLPRPGQKPELGAVVVTTEFLVPTLRYNLLDTTGAATAPGSYAFLMTAGDAASAIDNFSHSAWGSVELRVHPTDASGTSRAAFYDTVQVGDSFDYRTNGLACGFRFKVASIGTQAPPRTFGIEYVRVYGGRCGDFVADPGAAKDVHFVWKVPAGIPGPGGVRVLLTNEPAGEGTYRIDLGWPWVIDVPAGMQVIQDGSRVLEPAEDAPADAPRSVVALLDADTGSWLSIDPATGVEVARSVTSAEVGALFDQIMASLRSARDVR